MKKKMNLMEATILALQGHLVEEKKDFKKAKKEESATVVVNDDTVVDVAEDKTDIITPEETITVQTTPTEEPPLEEPTLDVEVPNEDLSVEEISDEEVEDILPEETEEDEEEQEDISSDEEVEESKKVEEEKHCDCKEDKCEGCEKKEEEENSDFSAIIKVIEDNDFKVNHDGDDFDISQYTPLGEDWFFSITAKTPDEFKENLNSYAENFDVDEEAGIYIDMRGKNGVPDSITDLVEDAKWKQKTLEDLAEKVNAVEIKVESVSSEAADEIENDDRYENGATGHKKVFLADLIAAIAESMGDDYSEWLDKTSIEEIIDDIDNDDHIWDMIDNAIREKIEDKVAQIRSDDPTLENYKGDLSKFEENFDKFLNAEDEDINELISEFFNKNVQATKVEKSNKSIKIEAKQFNDDEKIEDLKLEIKNPKLEPEFDKADSFYGKAITDGDKLYSYDVLVAEIKDGKPIVYNLQSQTTLRHVKEWLKQNGFKADNRKQIIDDYGAEDIVLEKE